MSNVVDLHKLFHRSKTRILELGEVFTPEQFVEDMLNLISKGKKNFWNNEDLIFFEPTCGHGNIVLPIYRRRLEAIYKKAEAQGMKNPHLYAVANAINTIWAIDIDPKNIEHTRSRLLWMTLSFLKEKLEIDSELVIIQKNQKFFTHLFCALLWQVHENEAISSLGTSHGAYQTKIGGKWLATNGHKQLNFDLTWATYYSDCEAMETTPIAIERSRKFIESLLSGNSRGYAEFEFAKFIVPAPEKGKSMPAELKPAVVGV